MEKHTLNSKKVTFLSVLGANCNRYFSIKNIEIPIIQRDYAQGRDKDKHIKNVRDQLIDSFYNALTKEEEMDLDFIYGYCTQEGTFIPLDGQQRLTTLFLLYWYIAKHEHIQIPIELKNFTYKTRPSSRDFLEKLLDKFTPSFQYSTKDTYLSISDEIKDQYWCDKHWTLTDPTIKSILVMLDTIHDKFKDEKNLWSILTDEKKKLISFYLLILGGDVDYDTMDKRELEIYQEKVLVSSEETYVKMNARGKSLTPFEHFKAYLEGILKSIDPEKAKLFICKIDTEWSDLFWNFLEEKLENLEGTIPHSLDNCLLRYYRFLAQMQAYQDPTIDNSESLDDFMLAKRLFSSNNPRAKANFDLLFDGFNCLTLCCGGDSAKLESIFDSIFTSGFSHSEKIRLYTEPYLFKKAIWYFGESGKRWNYLDSILLWSVISYLIKGENPNGFKSKRRLRQVRNMVWTSIGNEVRAENMNEILEDITAILFSDTFPIEMLKLNKRLATEELKKDKLISINPELYPYMCDIEDNKLLFGRIGVIGLDKEKEFVERAKTFSQIFSAEDNDDNAVLSSCDLGRILCVYDDFSEQIKNDRYKIGGCHLINWYQLFANYDKEDSNISEPFQMFLDECTFPINDFVSDKIRDFIEKRRSENNYDWRYYFSKYKEAFDGKSGIYVWSDDYDVRMLNSKQLNGYHRDVYLEMLYGKLKDEIHNNNRWLYGYTSIEQRILELDGNIKLKIGFSHSKILFFMRSNAKYFSVFENFAQEKKLIKNDKIWEMKIDQILMDQKKVDRNDRIKQAENFCKALKKRILSEV